MSTGITLNYDDYICKYGLLTHPTHLLRESLKEYCPEGVWLAGGAVRGLLTQSTDFDDYDLFFSDVDKFNFVLNNIEGLGYKAVVATPLATTFQKDKTKIQLIHINFYPTVGAVLADFDFTIVQCATDFENSLYVTPEFFMDSLNKELRFNLVDKKPVIKYPDTTFARLLKYSSKGFSVPVSTYGDYMQVTNNTQVVIGQKHMGKKLRGASYETPSSDIPF